MYSLTSPITIVRGIGQTTADHLLKKNITTVGQLLMLVPLRYEDRAQLLSIQSLGTLTEKTLVTLSARISSPTNQYKGRRSTQRAVARDANGKVKLMWFNSPYIITQLKTTEAKESETEYFISGTYDPKYQSIVAPTIERASADTIHTNRLVPIYTSSLPIRVGTLRRIIKHIVENLGSAEAGAETGAVENGGNQKIDATSTHSADHPMSLSEALSQLHFPVEQDALVAARERLALEEFLHIMKLSELQKQHWQHQHAEPVVPTPNAVTEDEWLRAQIPPTIPFAFTAAQMRCLGEIYSDLRQSTPMNRLLIGDVGAGKTVVAGASVASAIHAGHSVALIAPTTILAEQHFNTLQTLFPSIPIALITAKSKKTTGNEQVPKTKRAVKTTPAPIQPTLYVGTHSVINKLKIIRPAYIIYDEQQRFGVAQRSEALGLDYHPHVLTMTATPIPRSLMLTLFSHLKVSHLDELPPGRIPVKTWVVPESKRLDAYNWIKNQLRESREASQVFVVCPFIDPSSALALENVASATETFQTIKTQFGGRNIALLHGRLAKKEQESIINDVRALKTDILVTTPIVEVGVDLPAASIMVIDNAERFGLSSLHQLRGRVGRAGQQGYCLLFTKTKQAAAKERLKLFSNESKGLKLAEIDLQNRGSGDLFGVSQTGFGELKFASWTNLELITEAQQLAKTLNSNWRSPLFDQISTASRGAATELTPKVTHKAVLAN